MYLVAKVRCSSKRTDRFTLLSSKRKHESSLTSMQFTPVSMFVGTLHLPSVSRHRLFSQQLYSPHNEREVLSRKRVAFLVLLVIPGVFSPRSPDSHSLIRSST